MGAQPNQNDNLMVKEMSLNNYNGSLDYFIMLRNEYSVSLSQDPAKRQTLCQYFLKLQDLHIREQFYQIHPDITIVTDEELEVFINHYKKLIPITEIDHLKNVCEVKRKPGESPQTFVHRLKLLIGKINGVMSLTPSDAILLIITFINSPKKSHKQLLSKDTITTDDITREWQRFLEEDNFSKNNYNLSHQLSRHSQSYPAAPRQFNDNSNFYNLSNSSNTQHYTRPSNNIQSKFSNYPKRQSNFSSTQNQSKFGANYPNNYQSEFPNYPSSFHHSYEISHQQQPLSYHTSPFNQQSTNTFSNSTPPVNHQKSSNAPFKPSTRDYNNDKTTHDKINVHTKSLKVPQSFLTQPVLRTVLMIENVSTPVLIDGGSEVALIPLSFYDKYLKKRNYKIDKCNFTAVMANNVCENFIGSVDINVQCLETLQRNKITFYILSSCECTITNIHAHSLKIDITDKIETVMKSRENIVEKLYMIKEKDESLFNLFIQHEKVYNEQILPPVIEIDIPIVEPFPKRVQAAYPLNYEQKLVLGKKLTNEILDGYMTSISYPSHAVPVTVVHGTNGYRVCNDARLQNHNIIPMDIQLDNIISTILRLTDTSKDNDEERFYSVFDLKSAFKNFSIVPERRFLSNIITPLGTFTSDRLIFGLKSASALFHSTFLNLLEQEGCYNFALYVDDLIVYGNMTEQIQNISKILLLCSRNHIKLNITKTGLFLKETVYLGQSLTLTTISVTKKRIDELLSLPTPISKSQMYHYLGKLQFVSKFIKDYSALTKDLHPSKNNCDKNGKFIWNSTRIAAFDKIRDNIQNHYIFSIPKNSDQLFCQVFMTDVSFTVETYFYPDNTKGNRNILDIFSRIFQQSELNYNYIEKQLLALNEYFSRWSDNNRLPIIETCKLIESILKHDNCSAFSTRIQKLASIMIVKDVQVKVIKQVRTKMLKAITFPEAPLKFDFNIDEVIKFQSTDNHCKTLRTFMDTGNEDCLKKLPVAFSEKAELLEEIQGALAIDKRIIVSTDIAKKLIKKHHLLYHLGETKTYEYFRKIIFCIGLAGFCAQERKNCSVCMEYLNLPVAQVSHWITPIHPRSRGSIDYMFFEGTPIFALCDNATQYLFAWITPNKSTATIIQCLIPIFSQCPFSFLIMDNAKEFCSNEMLLFLSDFNCQPILVPSYHSKSNGCIERHNQIIRRGLQKNVELGKSLDESLRITLESHNLDKTRKFYCNDTHTEEFMHNRYHKYAIPKLAYYKRKGNKSDKYTLAYIVGELGSRIFHIKDNDEYFAVARDYVHMSVPQHLIDADVSLHDTIITDQNWVTDNDDTSTISVANCDIPDDVSNETDIPNEHDILDNKTDVSHSNDDINPFITLKSDSISNCLPEQSFIYANNTINDSQEWNYIKSHLKNETADDNICNNVNNEVLSPHSLNLPSASSSPISDLSKSFDSTTGTTLYSDTDIKEFIKVSSSDIFIFCDGSCPNSKATSSNVIKGVGIIKLKFKEKVMEYYKAHNFLSGRPTSARYEVAAVMISIILCQNETKKTITLLSDNTYSLEPIDRPEILSKYLSDISQAQNKLWKNIDSLMSVCTMRDIVWETKHFKSKTSSLNKLVDSLAKGIESKITKAVDDVKQNWPDFNIVEKELSPAHKRYFTGSDV